jgi:cholesterol 7-dehydrogenase
VYLTWKGLLGKGVFVQSLTPQEPLLQVFNMFVRIIEPHLNIFSLWINSHKRILTRQDLSHCIYAERQLPSFIAKFYMMGEALQVERDLMVWNNKMYRGKPLLVAEDGLIVQHRRYDFLASVVQY